MESGNKRRWHKIMRIQLDDTLAKVGKRMVAAIPRVPEAERLWLLVTAALDRSLVAKFMGMKEHQIDKRVETAKQSVATELLGEEDSVEVLGLSRSRSVFMSFVDAAARRRALPPPPSSMVARRGAGLTAVREGFGRAGVDRNWGLGVVAAATGGGGIVGAAAAAAVIVVMVDGGVYRLLELGVAGGGVDVAAESVITSVDIRPPLGPEQE